MADEGIDIPVNLDIDEAEKELLKLQKKISRTKISLDVAIGNKEELKKALAENEAKSRSIETKGGLTSEDRKQLAHLGSQWMAIQKQIRDAEAAEIKYNAAIKAAVAEYGKLSQEINDTRAAQGAKTAVPNELATKLAYARKQLADLQKNGVKAGEIELPVDVDIEAAEKSIEKLKKKAESEEIKLQASVAEEADWKRLLKNNKAAQSRIAKAQEQNGELTPAQQERSERLAQEQEYILQKIRDCQQEQLKHTEAVRQTTAEYQRMEGAVNQFYFSNKETWAEKLKDGLKGLLKLPLKGLQAGLKGIGSLALKAGSALKSMVGGAIKKGLSSIGKSLKNAAKNLLGLGDSSKKANGGFASGIFTILKYALSIRSLYMLVRKLKSALVDGFKNLAQFSGQTNSDISMVMSALTQLKNSLATAFAPILSVVAPILTTFINMLSSAATAVARLTAALTGKTSFVKATSVQQDYAASLNNTASAAGSAADAAKEASKTLAGFDEINKLDAPSGSSGGGGGGGGAGGGAGDMFTTEQIEPLNFDSWGAAFSAFLDKLLNDGIPMLKNALTSLAGWINDFAANVAEMFTFPGVYEKVVQLGQEVAGAFNDFVNQIDWATIGTALGAGFDLALAFLANLIYSFDFMNLGASLATMFNNAISQVNWTALGQLLWAKFKVPIETLAGFLLNLDMPELARSASQIATGFFQSITDTVASIDWQALGHQIATFLENVDWSGVAVSCFTAIGAAFGAAAAFLWGLIEDAWNSVVNWWHEVAYEDGHFTVKGLLDGIGDGLKNIFSWIKNNIFLPIWNGIKKAFGIASPSKEMKTIGNYISEGLLQGVKEKISAIIQTFQGLWTSIKNVFSNVSGWFKDKFSAAWQAVKDVFSTGGKVFDGIKEGILSGLKAVVNGLISGINRVIAVPFNGLNSALRSIKRVSIAGLRPFSWLPSISVPQIPRLAQGAVIPPNKEFLAVLGDQKNGTNIETPLSTMVQAFKQAMAESGGGSDVYIFLDSEQIAARVEKRQRQQSIRTNGVKAYG